jgi:plastocyanin
VIRGVALTALALATSGSSVGVQRGVVIPGKFFAPGREVVLIGDTVTWRNADSSSHTVTADDGAFDSGSFGPGATFSRSFQAAGVYKYHCSIHRYMRGEVDVYGLALKAPPYAVPVALTTALVGLAPPEVGQVSVRRRESDGRFVEIGTAAVAADGSFRVPLVAETPGVYLAAAGSLTSPPAAFMVAARVQLRARAIGRTVRVTVQTDPVQPAAAVKLQEYVRERFDFVTVRRGRLDNSGRAVFRLPPQRKLHLRALLPTGVRGYGRAVSRTVLVRPSA